MYIMKRVNLYLSEEQLQFLKEYPGTISEHIREAIDNWITQKKNLNVSISPTKGGRNE